MTAHLAADHFRRLAERSGADPDRTVEIVRATVHDLRAAWSAGTAAQAARLFPALATHYEQRLVSLPITALG